jgi:hypothetical protein
MFLPLQVHVLEVQKQYRESILVRDFYSWYVLWKLL